MGAECTTDIGDGSAIGRCADQDIDGAGARTLQHWVSYYLCDRIWHGGVAIGPASINAPGHRDAVQLAQVIRRSQRSCADAAAR
jgi:hypothetical protein